MKINICIIFIFLLQINIVFANVTLNIEKDNLSAESRFSSVPVINIDINPANILHKSNMMILGNNVQWTDDADGLWNKKTNDFNINVLNKLKQIKVTSLRFPGGSHSDMYHWKHGVGSVGKRKKGRHVFIKDLYQDMSFGTDEFLKLCGKLNSESIITVNIETGTAKEAAEWVSYCNKSENNNKRVIYWEIGNEPYLQNTYLNTKFDKNYPEKFAKKFVKFAKAMKGVDPDIKLGLPLRNYSYGRFIGTPYKEWNKRILNICKDYVDFIALHNAYFPYLRKDNKASLKEIFLSAMSASDIVKKSISDYKKKINKIIPKKKIDIAVTEYNSFWAESALKESKYISSFASVLYTGSLLIDFFKDNNIKIASFWSLIGNWHFGLISNRKKIRPVFYLFKIFSDYIGDNVVDVNINNNIFFNVGDCGYVPANKDIKSLKVLATVKDEKLYLIFVNRSFDKDIKIKLNIKNFDAKNMVKGVALESKDVFLDNETKENIKLREFMIKKDKIIIKKHSVCALQMSA